jgi:hypothetical protein
MEAITIDPIAVAKSKNQEQCTNCTSWGFAQVSPYFNS